MEGSVWAGWVGLAVATVTAFSPFQPIAEPDSRHTGLLMAGSDVKSRGWREPSGKIRHKGSHTGKGHAEGEGTR
jgi:hypothetical protein